MLRRYRMIVELTSGLIAESSTLTHREACCLIQCARESIGTMSPLLAAEFELNDLPDLERLVRERFPLYASSDTVN